jgi:N-methylhydantoinase B
MTSTHTRASLHPTTFAVIRESLINTCNEIGATLARTAYSPVIADGLDFAGALFDRHGRLVACGDYDLTGLLGTLEPTLSLVLSHIPRIDDGDVVICNLPHDAGNHLNDVRLVKPIFVDKNLVGFLGDVGHWTDIGGSTPGSINPLAHDIYAEGLQIPPTKIVECGVFQDAIAKLILSNVRLPHDSRGDLAGQLKALEVGAGRLKRLVVRYGVDTMIAVFDAMQHHAGVLLEEELRTIPDGVVEVEDWIDGDPLDPDRGPLRVHLRLTKTPSGLVADFTQSDSEPRAGVGSTWPLTQSGVFVSLLNLLPRVPFNHGFMERVEILTTPGTVAHASFPMPVSGCACGGFEKVMACVLRAVGSLAPEREVACPYNLLNVNLGGYDNRFDRPFVMYLWSEGGFGGGPASDGGDAPTLTMYASGSRNQSIEVHERFFPVEFLEVAMDPDTAGAGAWRGGPGVRHAYRLTSGTGTLGVFGDRNKFPPWGVHGGGHGSPHSVVLNPGTPSEQDLGVTASGVAVKQGDIIEMRSGGGGGYGDPRDRPIDLVLRDVMMGLVTTHAARTLYGVEVERVDELRHEWRVNEEATALLRRTRCVVDP